MKTKAQVLAIAALFVAAAGMPAKVGAEPERKPERHNKTERSRDQDGPRLIRKLHCINHVLRHDQL